MAFAHATRRGSAIAVCRQARSTSIAASIPAIDPGFVQTLYRPITTTFPSRSATRCSRRERIAVPQPTGDGSSREIFVQRSPAGTSIGPPRFSNQAATIHIYSNGSTRVVEPVPPREVPDHSLHPCRPTAKPTTNDPVAGLVTGLVTAFPQNFLNSRATLWT